MTAALTANDRDVRRGAGIYSAPILAIYDGLVIRFSNSVAWRCPSQLMLDQYNELLGTRHLDVGLGTGWYLTNVKLPQNCELTLVDLNPGVLETAAARINHSQQHKVIANVLEPLPEDMKAFDSIGTNFLFHCVPGKWKEKGIAFGHLAARLKDDGVLFGASILGSKVQHNFTGRLLMALYNTLGIFHNRGDDLEGLRASLSQHFAEINLTQVGTVAVYQARKPLR